MQRPAAGSLFGEPGVLAFDPLLDRIQCAVCGRWFEAITGAHLRKHDMTCEQYKQEAGLNIGTSLTTPRVQELKRQRSLAGNTERYLIKRDKGDAATLGEPGRHQHRAEWRRRRALPEARQHQALALRKWTDDEMLTALRDRQAAVGGRLRVRHLTVPLSERGNCPSYTAAIERFGSWRRICELLDQPYQPPNQGTWTEEAILTSLRVLRQELGGTLTPTPLQQRQSSAQGKMGRFPTYKTVIKRFGCWARVAQLLGDDETVRAASCSGTPGP